MSDPTQEAIEERDEATFLDPTRVPTTADHDRRALIARNRALLTELDNLRTGLATRGTIYEAELLAKIAAIEAAPTPATRPCHCAGACDCDDYRRDCARKDTSMVPPHEHVNADAAYECSSGIDPCAIARLLTPHLHVSDAAIEAAPTPAIDRLREALVRGVVEWSAADDDLANADDIEEEVTAENRVNLAEIELHRLAVRATDIWEGDIADLESKIVAAREKRDRLRLVRAEMLAAQNIIVVSGLKVERRGGEIYVSVDRRFEAAPDPREETTA